MTQEIKLLDHGYITLVETWGSDERIIEAARMSTNKGFQGWDTDQKLLAYLYNNNHSTPFEMAGAVFEIKAPIFVFREWHRHRTQSYNEMSGRYVPLPDENYIPTIDRILESALKAKTSLNKQEHGIGNELVFSKDDALLYQTSLRHQYESQQHFYEMALGQGIPKELARIHLPVGRYSRMRASANLRNWLAFLTLRNDTNAQYEIRVYAQAVQDILKEHFHRTMDLFESNERDQRAI